MGFDASDATFALALTPNISIANIFDPNTPVTSIGFPIPGANCLGLSVKGLSIGPASVTVANPSYKPITVGFFVFP